MSNFEREGRYRQLYSRLEATYQIAPNHAVGTSISYNRMPSNKGVANMKSMVFYDLQLTENSFSKIWTPEQVSSVTNNMYYVGKIGKVGFDFNLDWLWNKKRNLLRLKKLIRK